MRTAWAVAATFGIIAASVAVAAENQRSASPDAVIVGSVFRDPGFALAHAEVTLIADPEDAAKTASKKIKKQRTSTSPRGEFVFHVPAGPMRYRISASASGYKTEQKEVTVQGEGRTDVTLMLTPESKE